MCRPFANNDGRYMRSKGSPQFAAEGALEYLRCEASHEQPFCLIISLVNPHDVLLYPNNYLTAGYDDTWLLGDVGLPKTVHEDLLTRRVPDKVGDKVRVAGCTGLVAYRANDRRRSTGHTLEPAQRMHVGVTRRDPPSSRVAARGVRAAGRTFGALVAVPTRLQLRPRSRGSL
jgi:hypothetical protein